MRPLALALTLALPLASLAAAVAVARAEPERTAEERIAQLEREVAWLRGREERVTKALLAQGERGAALARAVEGVRSAGFATHAQPTQSRTLLLDGLAAEAAALQKDLPTLSEKERTERAALDAGR
ncbi:MAG: hypothetical protein ACKOSS_08145 [Planctomycetia bacterium]